MRLAADKTHLMKGTNALKKEFLIQQIITSHLLLLIMAFIWSSIYKLKLRALNHSLVCYKSLLFKTSFDQKASSN